MDSVGACGEVIVNHALLDFIMEFCCESQLEWVRFDRLHVDRSALLGLLPALAAVSKVTRMCAGLTVQYAALRLATYDLEVAAVDLSARRKANILLRSFDENMDVFMKSWKVAVEVPKELRMAALDELPAAELHRLRGFLCGTWQHKIQVEHGDDQVASPSVWVTPACR